MKTYALSMIAMLSLALFLTDLSTPRADEAADDLGTELRQTWEALKDYTIEQKNELVADNEDLLNALDARIDQARAAAAEASGDAKERWNDTVADLSVYREEAAERFEALQDSSAEAWEDGKRSLSETLDSLQRRLEDEPAEN